MRQTSLPVRFFRLAAVLLALCACAAICGCFHYHRGNPDRLTRQPPEGPPVRWPARDPDALRPFLDATPPEVRGPRPLVAGGPVQVTTVVGKGIYGNGLVREFRRPADGAEVRWLLRTFEPNAYVLTSRTLGSNRVQLGIARAARSRGSESEHEAEPPLHILLEEGVPVRFPDSLPDRPRGVLIHLWALTHNPYEERTVAEFARRGWVVIEIDSVSSARPDIADGDVGRILALEDERDAILRRANPNADDPPYQTLGFDPLLARSPELDRFVAVNWEISALEYPDIALCSESDLERAAVTVAELLDNAGAENAYAAEAALDHLMATRPRLAGLPVVVIGFSAGALSAPAAAVRLRDRIDALVMIGGAANVAEVAARSTITRGGLVYRCGDRPAAPALIERVAQRYLEHSNMDPYQLAPRLGGLPVLHVHASYDEWVPSDLARLLNARLSGPDRLVTMFGGHKFLFYFLPNQAGWIADWVERTVESGG